MNYVFCTEESVILRVISGIAKGHKLKTLKGNNTRPTSDKVKGSLFNILAGAMEGADVLDLFAGTGNLGIEALSRGANSATFIDKSSDCAAIIRENLIHTKLVDLATVLTGDIFRMMSKLANEGMSFDIIFLDPPYNKNLVEETLNCIIENDVLKRSSIVIAEHDIDDIVSDEIGVLKKVRSTNYGDTVMSFFMVVERQ